MSNLPPGVTESMIPGNRPEDAYYEKWFEDVEQEMRDDGYSAAVIAEAMKSDFIEGVIADAVSDLRWARHPDDDPYYDMIERARNYMVDHYGTAADEEVAS